MRDYEDVNIHAPSEKLRLTGLMQVMAVAEHPDTHWQSGIKNILSVGHRSKRLLRLPSSFSDHAWLSARVSSR